MPAIAGGPSEDVRLAQLETAQARPRGALVRCYGGLRILLRLNEWCGDWCGWDLLAGHLVVIELCGCVMKVLRRWQTGVIWQG